MVWFIVISFLSLVKIINPFKNIQLISSEKYSRCYNCLTGYCHNNNTWHVKPVLISHLRNSWSWKIIIIFNYTFSHRQIAIYSYIPTTLHGSTAWLCRQTSIKTLHSIKPEPIMLLILPTIHSKKFGVHCTPNLVCQRCPNWHTI